MKIVFHTGLHKTGSTSVQTFLDCNSEILERNSIFYPKISDVYLLGAHHPMAKLILNGSYEILESSIRKILDYSISKSINTIIFSSEDFEYLSKSHYIHLKNLFKGFDIKVVTFVRPQVELILSQYSQQIREGYIRLSFKEFYRDALQYAEFLKLKSIILQQYNLTENVIIRSIYDENYKKVNVVRDFIRIINFDENLLELGFIDKYVFNNSLSAVQLNYIKEKLQDDLLFKLEHDYKIKQIQNLIDQVDWTLYSNRNIMPTLDMYEECLNLFHDDNCFIDKLIEVPIFNNYYYNKINAFVNTDLDIDLDFELIQLNKLIG